MEVELLRKIGLNLNESLVYIDLVKLGKASVTQISKKTGLHRAVVHDNLERLVDKGLVAFITEGKKKVFHPNPPEMLTEMLEKKSEEINQKLIIAKNLQKNISQIYNTTSEKHDAYMLRGTKGVRLLYQEIIDSCKSYEQFGSPKVSVKIMGKTFWKNIDIKVKHRRIKGNLIFNESLRKHGKKVIKNIPTLKIKYIDHGFDPLTQTIIFGNRVAIIVWTDKPIITLINNKEVSKSYKSYFNILWGISKK
jgi:sugar-specific transcriptional regulator TrmB